MKNTVIKINDLEERLVIIYNVGLFCIRSNACSINRIETEFNYGFNRAYNAVSILEALGLVSEAKPKEARKILMTERQFLEIIRSKIDE